MYLPVLANYMYLVLYVFHKLGLPDPWPLCWCAAGYYCSLQLQHVSGFLIIRSWMQQLSCSCTEPCSWDIYRISLFYIWCFSLCSPKFFLDFFFSSCCHSTLSNSCLFCSFYFFFFFFLVWYTITMSSLTALLLLLPFICASDYFPTKIWMLGSLNM